MNSVVALGLAVAVLSPLPADRPDCLSLEGEPLRISTVQGAGPMAHTTSLSIRNGCDAEATVRLRLSPSDGNPSGASAIRTEFRAEGVTLLSAPWDEVSDPSAAILVPSGVLDLTVRTTVGSGEAPPAPGVHIADFEADWVVNPDRPAASATDILGVTGGEVGYGAVLVGAAALGAGVILRMSTRRRSVAAPQEQKEEE